MSEPKLHLEKMLFHTNIYVQGDDAGRDFVQEIEQNRHGTSMSDRVAEWLGELRKEYLSREMPDPLCWIEVKQDGSWKDVSDETLETDIVLGISYIRSNLPPESLQLAQLGMLESACGFLVAHGDGNTEAAYRSLSDFVQMHTLLWAEDYARDDVQRGRKTLASASAGGQERSRIYAARNDKVLREMRRLFDEEPNVSRAARLAFKRGFGTSVNLNRKLWYASRK